MGGKTRIPSLTSTDPLGTVCTSNADKSELLYKTFFPPLAPVADQPEEHEYPHESFPLCRMSDTLITDIILKLQNFKASGPDGIPNEVFRRNASRLLPFLGRLFCATFTLAYYPE